MYKRKASGAFVPTPSEIKQYFESQGFDVNSITDEQFIQSFDYFSQGELSIVSQSESQVMPADKSELVVSAAQSLGIVLNTQEIAEIAANVNYFSDDLHDSLDEIKSKIVAFVKYKSSLNAQKINEVIDDINHVVADEFDSNSQQLTNGLNSINQQIRQQNSDFKSQVRSALQAFAVPNIKPE